MRALIGAAFHRRLGPAAGVFLRGSSALGLFWQARTHASEGEAAKHNSPGDGKYDGRKIAESDVVLTLPIATTVHAA